MTISIFLSHTHKHTYKHMPTQTLIAALALPHLLPKVLLF